MENSRPCPVCNTPSDIARLFLKENVDPSQMNEFSFASRKLPEFMCYQLVQCPTCDLVYANAPPDQSVLAHAYHVSDFDSEQEANDASAAYEKAMEPMLKKLLSKESVLEIGTGTGVFLDALQRRGFQSLVGVEPSSAAIAAAPDHRKPWFREGIFRATDFEPESFDLICCFMTMEHVRDPYEITEAASQLLKPGGGIALVVHDYRSPVNRILGRRSPIIDVEHMQLFSPQSIEQLLKRSGLEGVQVSTFTNRYALRYWIRLLPLSVGFKKSLIKVLEMLRLADIKLSFNVGNMMAYAFRPAQCR